MKNVCLYDHLFNLPDDDLSSCFTNSLIRLSTVFFLRQTLLLSLFPT